MHTPDVANQRREKFFALRNLRASASLGVFLGAAGVFFG